MKKKVKDLKCGEVFSMAIPTGLVDIPTLIVAMVKRFDGDIQIVSNLIDPKLLNNIEVYVYDNKEDDNDSDRT